MHSHAQSHKLVTCALSHVCILYKWLCLCVLYSTMQSTVGQYIYFKSKMSSSKSKRNSDVAGTAKQSQEAGNGEMMQEMARGFSLFEEVLLVFEAGDSNVKQYEKVAIAVSEYNPALPCHL